MFKKQTVELVSAEHFNESQSNFIALDNAEQNDNAADPLVDSNAFSPESNQMEPVYVNEKQYARILKRRAARAKLEMEGRIPKQRRVRIRMNFPTSGPLKHPHYAIMQN
jgi:hypothetical protein